MNYSRSQSFPCNSFISWEVILCLINKDAFMRIRTVYRTALRINQRVLRLMISDSKLDNLKQSLIKAGYRLKYTTLRRCFCFIFFTARDTFAEQIHRSRSSVCVKLISYPLLSSSKFNDLPCLTSRVQL